MLQFFFKNSNLESQITDLYPQTIPLTASFDRIFMAIPTIKKTVRNIKNNLILFPNIQFISLS